MHGFGVDVTGGRWGRRRRQSVVVQAGRRHVRDEQLLERPDPAGELVDLAVDDEDTDRADERDEEGEHLKGSRGGHVTFHDSNLTPPG